MNRAQQLVRKLVEAGPDELRPKGEVLRLPDPVPEIYYVDPENEEAGLSWHNDLARQLNRLSGLTERLKRANQNQDAADLAEIIERVAEFENVGKVQQQ
jgi:hypothetical protein